MKTLPLKEQIIWLTGASSGIGAALIPALQSRCKHLIITARNADALSALANGYSNVTVQAADITNEQQLQQVANYIGDQFGRIDTLIANAGTCEYVDVKTFNTGLFRRVMDTNFMGLVYTVAAALPWLRQSQRGYLVGMSSSVTWLAMPRAQAYGASKAATRHFLEAMRADLWHEGMDVSVISPGFVQTPLTDRNDFPMPGRISAEQAALAIISGLEKRRFDIHFPKRFTWVLQLLGALPAAIRFRITRAMSRTDNPTSSSGDKH